MNYKLHYAELNLQGDIHCIGFKNWKERLSFLMDKIICPQKKVFIISINYNANESIDSVYVFDVWNCVRFLNEKRYNSSHYTFFLQEYESYEEAYKVALNMKEVNKLCYSDVS